MTLFFSFLFSFFLGKKQHVITSREKLPYPTRELMFLLQWKKWKGEKVITPFRTQDNIYYTVAVYTCIVCLQLIVKANYMPRIWPWHSQFGNFQIKECKENKIKVHHCGESMSIILQILPQCFFSFLPIIRITLIVKAEPALQ